MDTAVVMMLALIIILMNISFFIGSLLATLLGLLGDRAIVMPVACFVVVVHTIVLFLFLFRFLLRVFDLGSCVIGITTVLLFCFLYEKRKNRLGDGLRE